MRKNFLSERNLVVVLFVMVFVIFSFAHEDTKKFEKIQTDPSTTTSINPSDNPGHGIKAEQITPASQLR